MKSEVKLATKGLTFVGFFLFMGLIILANFFYEMAHNALAGGSERYAPRIPAAKALDITKVAQCNENYPSKWVGCNRLAE